MTRPVRKGNPSAINQINRPQSPIALLGVIIAIGAVLSVLMALASGFFPEGQ